VPFVYHKILGGGGRLPRTRSVTSSGSEKSRSDLLFFNETGFYCTFYIIGFEVLVEKELAFVIQSYLLSLVLQN
jgi:hypothetical protein